MKDNNQSSRRRFIKAGGIFIAASGVGAAVKAFAKEEEKENEEVSPPEDLMREHGVLKRILLIYGEAIRRIDGNGGTSARMARSMYLIWKARKKNDKSGLAEAKPAPASLEPAPKKFLPTGTAPIVTTT